MDKYIDEELNTRKLKRKFKDLDIKENEPLVDPNFVSFQVKRLKLDKTNVFSNPVRKQPEPFKQLHNLDNTPDTINTRECETNMLNNQITQYSPDIEEMLVKNYYEKKNKFLMDQLLGKH